MEMFIWFSYACIVGGVLGWKGFSPLSWKFWAWNIPLLIVGNIIITALFN